MKLTFLGSGSAEGIPALFCRCKVCREAREKHRFFTRSQLLADGDLLMDFPPDSYFRALNMGIDLADIKHVLITHSHSDHFYPEDFFMRGLASSHGLEFPLTVYGSETVCALLREKAGSVRAEDYRPEKCGDFCGMDIYPQSTVYREVKPYEIFDAGDYCVAALPSAHMPDEPSYVYAVTRGKKSFLYATDTAPLGDKIYRFSAEHGYKFDCVIYDSTYGKLDFDEGHMNFADCARTKRKLQSFGLLAEGCKHVLTHISHNAVSSLSELEHALPEGFTAAYDGYTVNL